MVGIICFDLMTVFRRVSSPLFGKVTSTMIALWTTTRNPGVLLLWILKEASEVGMDAQIHAQVRSELSYTIKYSKRSEFAI